MSSQISAHGLSLPHFEQRMSQLLKLVEQSLGVVQVGGVEAFGEPVVDVGEHRARLVATALRCEQSREAHRRAQFPCLRAHRLRERDRLAKVSLREFCLSLLSVAVRRVSEESRADSKQFVGIRLQRLFDRFKRIVDGACTLLRLGQVSRYSG